MTVTLQDLVYFGTYWQILDRQTVTVEAVFGGGYSFVALERTSEGDMFAGIVEKRDSQGRVTDLILAFAGANGADVVQATALSYGIALDEPLRAAALFDDLMSDPAYAGATIHVTGHSLGAGYTQYLLGHSLANYGVEATDARASFLAFGAPTWLPNIADSLGVDRSLVESRFTDYTAINDPVLGNGREANGFERLGVTYYLPAFDAPLPGVNLVAAHWPTTYSSALGLPDWLDGAEQQAAVAAVSADFATGDSYDPDYGAPGTLDMLVWGSSVADRLNGRDGADTIVGHGGADLLHGGDGADLFQLLAPGDSGPSVDEADRVLDFSRAEGDRIDLSWLDANPTTLLFQEGFAFVGALPFTGIGQVRSWVSGNTTWVAGNLDADGSAEFMIRLDGRHFLQAGDFLLGSSGLGDLLPVYPNPEIFPYL